MESYTEHTEMEMKLTAPDFAALEAAFAAAEADAVSAAETLEMEAVYYDTPENGLRANGLSVRFRTENGVGIVTCKTRGGADERGLTVRGEYAAEAKTLAEGLCALNTGLPEPIRSVLNPLIPELRPIAEVQCTRRERRIRVDGCEIALALDRGLLNGEEPFGELEAELKAGNGSSLRAYGEMLMRRFGLQPENRSKLARALAQRRNAGGTAETKR